MEGTFKKLNGVNVNAYTEKKKVGNVSLTYLSWAAAWRILKEQYPTATYRIHHFKGKPYIYDEALGYMCAVSVTVEGLTHTCHLPVLDGANKAMKAVPYSYFTKDYASGGQKEKFVDAATMFDINTTIMRCLVKAIALHGLGLYIYEGEDLPVTEDTPPPVTNTTPPANTTTPRGMAQFTALLEKYGLKISDIAEPNLTAAEKQTVWQKFVADGVIDDIVKRKYPNKFA